MDKHFLLVTQGNSTGGKGHLGGGCVPPPPLLLRMRLQAAAAWRSGLHRRHWPLARWLDGAADRERARGSQSVGGCGEGTEKAGHAIAVRRRRRHRQLSASFGSAAGRKEHTSAAVPAGARLPLLAICSASMLHHPRAGLSACVAVSYPARARHLMPVMPRPVTSALTS